MLVATHMLCAQPFCLWLVAADDDNVTDSYFTPEEMQKLASIVYPLLLNNTSPEQDESIPAELRAGSMLLDTSFSHFEEWTLLSLAKFTSTSQHYGQE